MPSKRAKLSHASPEDARASSEQGVPQEDDNDEDSKDPAEDEEEEAIEEVEEEEGEDDDEQQEMGDQETYAIDMRRETEAEDADIEEEEEEEEIEREVIEEEEEEDEAEEEEEEEGIEVEVEVEVEEEEVDEEGAGAGETERGDLEEEEVDVEYEEEDEAEEVVQMGDHDVDSSGDSANVEEEVEDANGGARAAEEDDEADEDAHDADEDVLDADRDAHDTDGDAYDAVEDVNDADEDNDCESREQLAMEEDDEDGDGDGEEDNDEYDNEPPEELVTEDGDGDGEEDAEDERRKQVAILMCFTSLQCLMATELCRDMTPPFGQNGVNGATTLPGAFLKLILLAVTSLMQEEGRQCWKLQRPGQESNHIERGVSATDAGTRDSIWRRKYSISYACFLYLVEELRPFIQSESQIYVRAPLEIERAVAMVLYRFAHGLSAREVAEKYNVGPSTVGKYTLIVASALAEVNKLYGRYVAIPTGDRMARIISQFQQITNVSQMCGAIDGTHIKLHFKPDKWYNSSTRESTEKSHSLLLQAVCDASKLFWDVCCMAPGSGHEAAHFIASNLYQNIKEGLSLQEPELAIESKEVTPYMVGDSVYPLRPFLIKPFDKEDPLRRAFDEQLRKGSACIDGAFGILKTRWKILKCMNVHLMHAPRITIACCVLHNICQLWGEPEPPQQQTRTHSVEQTHGLATSYEIDEAAKIAGEAVREALFRDWVKRSLENSCVSLDQENMFSGQS